MKKAAKTKNRKKLRIVLVPIILILVGSCAIYVVDEKRDELQRKELCKNANEAHDEMQRQANNNPHGLKPIVGMSIDQAKYCINTK